MKRSAGFTLVEMLIVLGIIAILAALVYPGFAGYVTKTRRIEGQIALVELMQQQERFYSQNNSYIAFSSSSTDPDEKRFRWWSGSSAPRSAYELRGRACPGRDIAHCIELQALPGTSLVDANFKDRECEALTLTSTGEHTSSGTSERCWP